MDYKKLKSLVHERIAEDERELELVNRRLVRLPDDKYVIRHRGTRNEYYKVSTDPASGKRVETYISPKKRKEVLACCNKKYCLELKPILEEEIELLNSFADRFEPEHKYEVNKDVPPDMSGRFSPVAVTQKEKCGDWAKDDYKRNIFPFDETSMYASEKGDIVRSRAECLAANILFNLGVDYRYECILYIGGSRCIFPDFTVMHPETGEIWFIELFGMMGKAEYALEAFRRINDYAKSPSGDHVLFFFDYPGAPFDPDAFKALVQRIFLP